MFFLKPNKLVIFPALRI